MRILHTADWHIGQLFHEYDRTYEHQQFLDWLLITLAAEQIDVLLISGDVFDHGNPSATSIRMFYKFLNLAVKASPHLQIIVTAGNHDSASRLESPKPLLESSAIHIVGVVERDVEGQIDFEKLTIPLKDANGDNTLSHRDILLVLGGPASDTLYTYDDGKFHEIPSSEDPEHPDASIPRP